ncbi:hypothetical protein Taro_045574 [Colocasia esculenta]|uniref:WRKY domain-containing protein n=1 Tax=Colocasia esculenta TaxID=4460 RepID=A0A843WXD5_COLES|nr:hypothetical protein [Colocasia esculenta]
MAAALIACKDEDSSNSGSGGAHFSGEQEEAASVPRDYAAGAPPPPPFPLAGTPTPDTKLGPTSPAASSRVPGNSSSPSPKRSGRRSVQKRVVSIPITDADGSRTKGCGEGAPPSDSWAWRKYGQKPIKGSPYPRGYYRCSSSKGCPARKQVERSRVDPNMLVVTYASEHNHPWPLPKNNAHHHHHQQQQQQKHLPQQQPSPPAAMSPPKPSPPDPDAPGALPGAPAPLISSPASADLEESSFAADLLGDDASLVMMPDEFGWFSDVSTSSPPVEAFLGSAMMPMLMEDDMELGGGDAAGDEESSLFAGLGELPECAVVFRRVRMKMVAPEAPRGVAAAPCCGTTR